MRAHGLINEIRKSEEVFFTPYGFFGGKQMFFFENLSKKKNAKVVELFLQPSVFSFQAEYFPLFKKKKGAYRFSLTPHFTIVKWGCAFLVSGIR